MLFSFSSFLYSLHLITKGFQVFNFFSCLNMPYFSFAGLRMINARCQATQENPKRSIKNKHQKKGTLSCLVVMSKPCVYLHNVHALIICSVVQINMHIVSMQRNIHIVSFYRFQVLKFMYLWHKGLLPKPFSNYFQYASNVHKYSTRYASNQNLYVKKVRTNMENRQSDMLHVLSGTKFP